MFGFKKIVFLFLLLVFAVVKNLFAVLTPGDIAFVQYNADGTDNFAFVCLVNIPGSEVIKFTDNGWKTTNAWRTGEGIITWTAPIGGVPCGTIVTITNTPTVTAGSVTQSGSLNFSASGDQITAYQGVSTIIAALNNNGAAVWQANATSTVTSSLPIGLTNGTNATALTEIDNAKYNGVTTTGSKTALLAAINNKANWGGSNTVNQTYAGTFTVTSCAGACTPPTTQPNTLSFSAITTTSMQINYTNTGNGTGQLIVVRAASAITSSPTNGIAYTANTIFGSGSDIGTGEFVVHKTNGGPVIVTGLSPNTIYFVSIFEYNTIDNCFLITAPLTGSQSTPCNSPTTQSSTLTISAVSATGMTIGWTNGNGSNRIVLVKAVNAVNANPVDGTTYTTNTVFTSGTQIGTGNYVMYANTANSVSITGLTGGTTYHIAVYEYNNTSKCYLTTTPLIGNQTTSSSSSDIIAVGTSESATVSSVVNTAGPLTSTQGVQVWQFTIRDGGGVPDIDALPTTTTAITFSQNSGNAMGNWLDAIKSADLFDGTTHLGTAIITSTQLQFTGMTITTADNTNKIISLRISLNCGLADVGNIPGDDFVFQISQANVTEQVGGSSNFSAFTAINSLNSSNVYTVTATELRFSTQPSSTGINQVMSTTIVKATDACGNVDIGNSGTVSISSTGTLSGTSTNTVVLTSGVANFNNIIHSVLGTGLTLTASLAGLLSTTSTTFDIVVSTAFTPGDFAFVAVNTSRLAAGSSDEICFITFKDIAAGTSFDITDNGYERATAGTWGDTEGTMRFTRAVGATTILAGTVICIEGPDAIYTKGDGINNYDIYVCGVSDDVNWTATKLTSGTMDWNSNDQVWIMQGGTWNVIAGAQNDTYTGGNVIYGWTALSWKATPGYASTSGSTLYPNFECLNTDVTAPGNKTKYTGIRTAADKFSWIARINNSANWTNYANNTAYAAAGTDYYLGTCVATSVPVTPNTRVAGKWSGSTSTDWANCTNWETLIVPDASTSVTLPIGGGIVNEPNISTTGAICKNITIETGRTLTINNTGDLSIYGSFTNNGTYVNPIGTVTMTGLASGTISGTSATSFYKLVHNKTGANTTLNSPITITNNLTLTSGNINTSLANLLTLVDNATVGNGTTAQAGNANSFVDGPIKKIGNDIFTFPTGNGGTWGRIGITAPTLLSTEYTAQYFKSAHGVTTANAPLNNVSIVEYWDLAQGVNNDDIQIELFWESALTSGISSCSDITIGHYYNPGSGLQWYEEAAVSVTGSLCSASNSGSVKTSGIVTNYSPFTFGSKGAIVNPLPIELISFTAIKNNNKVDLSWITATEINNDYFTILKSYDGIHFFEQSTQNGAGNSNEVLNYVSIDYNIDNHSVIYYQLKQTDFDGASETSDIRMVEFSNETKFQIQQFNNSIKITPKEASIVTLYNNIGQTVFSKKLVPNQIENIELNNASGIYILNIKSKFKSISKKLFFK